MKPPLFEYADPRTLEDAVRLLGEHGASAKVLAGGQSLVPMLNMRLARPDVIVDLNRISGLKYLRCEDEVIILGALVRHHDATVSSEVGRSLPLLIKALPYVGHAAIRFRGTVCGSVAHADPAAEVPAVMTALGATMVIRGPSGTRRVGSDEFFQSWFTTALSPEEMLVELRVPAQPLDAGSSFLEVARRSGDFAQVGVAVTLRAHNGELRDVRLVGLAVGSVPVRLRGAEAALEGQQLSDERLDVAGDAAQDEISPTSDIHSGADYKRSVLRALLRRGVRGAVDDSLERQQVR